MGYALGSRIGPRLDQHIARYIETGPARHSVIDVVKMHAGALDWLRNLPRRFQEEFEGISEGAGIPLQRLAEWCYVEECLNGGCSALLCRIDGRVWVARNNDYWANGMWGYATLREVGGRIPRLDFGMDGDVFSGTGLNGEGLWLHYNWLPAPDAPRRERPHLACFVLLAEALETCRDLLDVEALLRGVDRHGGMLLFAVDGKTDDAAIYECTCTGFVRQVLGRRWIAGTNHYRLGASGAVDEHSHRRLDWMDARLDGLWRQDRVPDLPRDLIGILADDGVEQRGVDHGTVYANVACPGERRLWATFGGYPAASAGAWRAIEWPFREPGGLAAGGG